MLLIRLLISLVLTLSTLSAFAQPAPARQSATEPALDLAQWEPEIEVFEAADRAHPAPAGSIVFTGSSSIRLWKTLAEDFPGQPVLNRGFGGSQIREVRAFADRIVLPYEPSLVVMYCGGNDIHAGLSAEQVFADYREFVSTVHAALPKTRIAYISIAPNPARWSEVERVKTANRLIAAWSRQDPRLQFIDVYSEMLGSDGRPKPDIFVEDGLHMNEKGYEIWTRVVGQALGLKTR
jgi:lysophospholipase L1-like esterase